MRDFDVREVNVARALLSQSRQVWLAADHSKFDRAAMVEVGRLEQVDRLYTDRLPPEPFPALLQQAGVVCVTCGGDGALVRTNGIRLLDFRLPFRRLP